MGYTSVMGELKKSSFFIIVWMFIEVSSDNGCCEQTRLGNTTYIFSHIDNETSRFHCASKCVYSKVGEPKSRYCFRCGGEEQPFWENPNPDMQHSSTSPITPNDILPQCTLLATDIVTLHATCDDDLLVFADGEVIGNNNGDWTKSHSIKVPIGTRVLGLMCKDTGGAYGIVASTDTGVFTNESWICSGENITGWAQPGFKDEDNKFSAATSGTQYDANPDVASVPQGIDNEAKSIWGPTPGGFAFCRMPLCANDTQENPGACIEEGVDFFGGDIGYIADTETSLQCACSCRNKEECKFFTYNAGSKLCILKATEGTRRNHSKAYSGSERCCEDDLPTETDQGTLVFEKKQEFILTRNNKLSEVDFLGEEYTITFQLLLTAGTPATTSSTPGSIIHFTIGGDCCGVPGDRTPGLWVYNGTEIVLRSTIDGQANYGILPDQFPDLPAISLNTWHTVEISQLSNGSEIVFYMKLDGSTIATKINNQPRSFKNVKIFAGDDWYDAAFGKMKNLIVKTKL